MSAIQTLPAPRELAYRSTNGVDVLLVWRRVDDTLAVVVVDEHAGAFELVVSAAEALDAFEHPYAYAAHRGIELNELPPEPAA